MKTTPSFTFSVMLLAGIFSACQSGKPAETTEQPATELAAPEQPEINTPANHAPAAETTAPAEEAATGIDVSHFNGAVKWEEVKSAGIDFAYSKATQGKSYIDPKFSVNEQNSGKAGLKHGAYHFYVAADDPKAQANLFIAAMKKLDDGTLPPVLDLEQGGVVGKVDVQTFQTNVKIWLAEVEKALGIRPLIYTNTPFGNQYLNHKDFAEYELWIAEYGVRSPRIPKAWEQKGWLIWQRTDRDKIEGMIGTCDQDTLKGPIHLLAKDKS